MIMHVYVILYNMAIEDEHEGAYNMDDYEIVESFVVAPTITSSIGVLCSILYCEIKAMLVQSMINSKMV